MYRISIAGLLLFFLASCQTTIPLERLVVAKKKEPLRHLSLDQAIRQEKLEQADDLYLVYRDKHPESDKIPSLMLRLAQAHITQKEYLLARYYTESYIRDYPDGRRVGEVWFLRLKSLFLRYVHHGNIESEGELFQGEVRSFLYNPAYRKYHTEARKLYKRYKEIQHRHNEALALYYEKRGKQKAADFYRQKNAEAAKVP